MSFRYLKFILCLGILFAQSSCDVAYAQFTTYQRSLLQGKNQLTFVNPGFESGTTYWTASGGTVSSATSGANLAFGARSIGWDASGAQTLTGTQVTLEKGLYGKACMATVWQNGGDQNLTFEVINGSSTVLASSALNAQSQYGLVELPFTCPTSGTVAVRISAAADAAQAYFDDFSIGLAPKVVQPAEAGGLIFPNYNAEYGTTSGWKTFKDAAATTPVDCTGGTASTLWTANGTTPILGSNDFVWTKSANDRQGEGVSIGFSTGGDIPRLLAISFKVKTPSSNYTAGDLSFYIYDVTNTTLITPPNNTIPANFTGTVSTSFSSTTSSSYRLCIYQTSSTASAQTTYFDEFYVGPGKGTVQGAAVSGAQSFTISTTGFGSFNALASYWWRDGEYMEGLAAFQSGTPASSPTLASITVPGGYHINSSAVYNCTTSANCPIVGDYSPGSGTGSLGYLLAAVSTDTTKLYFGNRPTSTGANVPQSPNTIASSADYFTVKFRIPIAEWAGNGTVNIGPLNGCEYATNSSTATAASDTTSFAYNFSQPVQNITANLSRRVRFRYAYQLGDSYGVMVSKDGALWSDVKWQVQVPQGGAAGIDSILYQGTTVYGLGKPTAISGSQTDFDIEFGQYGHQNNGTYGGAGQAWSAGAGAYYWTAWHCTQGSAVGFALAQANGTPGLYTPGRTFGYTGGTTIGSGYVGEQTCASLSNVSLTNNITTNAGSITVAAGVYLLYGKVQFSLTSVSSITYAATSISTTSSVDDSTYYIRDASNSTGVDKHIAPLNRYAIVGNAGQTFYITATTGFSGGSVSTTASGGRFCAIRIQ